MKKNLILGFIGSEPDIVIPLDTVADIFFDPTQDYEVGVITDDGTEYECDHLEIVVVEA